MLHRFRSHPSTLLFFFFICFFSVRFPTSFSFVSQFLSKNFFSWRRSAAPPAKPRRSRETQLAASQVFFSAVSSVRLSFTFPRSLSRLSPCWSCRSNSFTFPWSLFCSWDGFRACKFSLPTSASSQRFFSLLRLPSSVFIKLSNRVHTLHVQLRGEVLRPDPRLHAVLKAAGRLNPAQQPGLKVHQSIFQMQIPLLLIFVLTYFSQQPRY